MLFQKQEKNLEKFVEKCPYCAGTKIIKKGIRQKKFENAQVYYCLNCDKKFTPNISKNKTYPLRIILEAITLYNRMTELEKIVERIQKEYGIKITQQTILNWIKDFSDYLPFLRMREFAAKKYKPKDMIDEMHMLHGQIYDFKYHRAKTEFILEENWKHQKLKHIKSFLDLVSVECPHNIFMKSTKRASEYKNCFDLDEVKITDKSNTAGEITNFVMQAVANNKLRHEILQEFMLANDSVTVAVEVPVLLSQEDILHFQNELGWKVSIELGEEDVITGHIDIVQIRNGAIHILDYKPSAKKVKPVEQLTLYALALSRLTSLRLFYFKCAWFDENDYFEFYPLHVVMKKKKKKQCVKLSNF